MTRCKCCFLNLQNPKHCDQLQQVILGLNSAATWHKSFHHMKSMNFSWYLCYFLPSVQSPERWSSLILCQQDNRSAQDKKNLIFRCCVIFSIRPPENVFMLSDHHHWAATAAEAKPPVLWGAQRKLTAFHSHTEQLCVRLCVSDVVAIVTEWWADPNRGAERPVLLSYLAIEWPYLPPSANQWRWREFSLSCFSLCS